MKVKTNPGIMASLLGTPADVVGGAYNAVFPPVFGAPVVPETAYGGRHHLQQVFDGAANGFATGLEANPANSVAFETLKGGAKGASDILGSSLGFKGNNSMVDSVNAAGAGFTSAFTQTVEERNAANEAAKALQSETNKKNASDMVQKLRDAQTKYLSSDGSGGTLQIPLEGGGASDAMQGIRDLINSTEPVDASTEGRNKWKVLTESLAKGAAAAGGSDASIGNLLLGMGVSGLAGEQGEKDRVAGIAASNKKARDDFALRKADSELALKKFEMAISEKEAPKFHNTGNGLIVEMTETDAEGNRSKVLKPFTGNTYKNASQLKQVLSGLGIDDVQILSSTFDIEPGDPLAEEQAAMAELQGRGKLKAVFGDLMGSPEWNDMYTEIQQQSIGEPQGAVEKLLATQRIAYLASAMSESPQRWLDTYKILNGER